MVQLFLSEPKWNEDYEGDSSKQIMSLLNKLESVICSLVTCGGRSEARLWLCSTLSGIKVLTPRQQRELFVSLLRSKPTNQGLASQLLQMIFEKRPQKLGLILAKRSSILEKFFEGYPKRILHWFSDFAHDGGSDHKRGAKALAQFAFTNRDICWEELEWRGNHGQSPAVVATKPHYFLDLDVHRTVENFLENVPEFWSSDEFAGSLTDGQILFLDTTFFLDLFVNFMYNEDLRDVWEAINEFLMEESFSSLAQHLLITLKERDLCHFLELLRDYVSPRMEPTDVDASSFWIQIILSKCNDLDSIDQMLLLNAPMNQGRQLLRLVHDEEINDEPEKLKEIISKISTALEDTGSFSSVLKECCKMKKREGIKLLGILSWVIHYRLSEECQTLESWETLFRKNEINFRKSDNNSLLSDNVFSEESESDLDDRSKTSKTRRRKKSKRKKKRRKNFDRDMSNDELLEFDVSNREMGLHHGSGSWLLSTDGFSETWTNVDLPEYFSRHCLSTWMKWLASRWSKVA